MNERTLNRMTRATTSRVREDFDRLAAFDDDRWDHNRHYHEFLLQFVPATGSGIEIGCGTGSFARELAKRLDEVRAIDLSPQMLERARTLSHGSPNLTFERADFMTLPLAEGSTDCIVAIATLHHLPLEEALLRMRSALRPGGRLIVLDLYQNETIADWIWSAAALPVEVLLRLRKLRRFRESAQARRAWAEHARHDTYPTLQELTALADRLLPGAQLRRHLLWRYSLVWQKPR